MTRLLALALILTGVLSCRAAERREESMPPAFRSEDLQDYVGRTVGELVAALPPYEDAYPLDEPPGKLIGFALRLPGGKIVDVYARDLRHVPRFREDRKWSFEDFKKERISRVVARE